MDGSSFDVKRSNDAVHHPIAIIGASCRFPGAPDLAGFAALLAAGVDAVTEIPDARWNKARLLHPERGQPGKTYTFAAGVLDQIDRFDPGFFGISPREAAQIDPQQRLMLELSHEAIEDSGLDGARLAGSATGVFVGGSAWDYLNLHLGDAPAVDAYTMTGVTLCSLANRVSYAFDLHGPSFTVDTACSSSLVALHQACEALRAGQVPIALVGGVNLLLAPQSFVGFSAASMLSPRGRCHAFDERADGYVRAEGGGVIVLKRLADAIAAGDRVRAVIRGTGVNSDGRTTGFSLPNQAAQAALLRDVYERFDISPRQLAYVEAHGTGTQAGDPIEAGALGEVLGRARDRSLPIGSVKTNIGHLEAASGMAGLLKAMLVLQQGRIPASLHCERPNPRIPFADLNLSLVPREISFQQAHAPALVGVNSFGFGGTNAHAVLENYPFDADDPVSEAETPPLLLSARSEEALRDLALAWQERLKASTAPAALVRGAARYREQHKLRVAVAGSSAAELTAGLAAYCAGRGASDVLTGTANGGLTAFVFSGNGAQWVGMAGDAIRHSPAFRDGLAAADAALRPFLGWSVADRIGEVDDETFRDAAVAQPLLFAVQVASVLALEKFGVHPDACMGHSVGEVAAAWACGALDLPQAARVIAARSLHQRAARDGNGGMAVIGLGAAAAADALDGTGIEVAAHNSDSATTIAGPSSALAAFAEEAERQGWAYTRLDLDHAFHSAAMDPIRAPLLRDLAGLRPKSNRTRFVSSVTGAPMSGEDLVAGYWWRNVREPVRFNEAARALAAAGTTLFVEIGPQPILQAYLHAALRGEARGGRALCVLSRRPARRDPMLLAALACHAAGADIRGSAFFAGPSCRDLPRYPWQRERFWVEQTVDLTDPVREPMEHPLLGARRDHEPLEWSHELGLALQPWLADHSAGGVAVLPAAAIIDIALAAARARHPDAVALEVLDLEISRSIVLEPGLLRNIRLRILGPNGGFELASRRRLSGDPWSVCATGRVVASDDASYARLAAPRGDTLRTVDPSRLYALATALGLEYGPVFQTVAGVAILSPTDAVVSLVDAPIAGQPGSDCLLSPPRLDGAFQGLVALAADLLEAGSGVLPWRFGRVRLLRPAGTRFIEARLSVTRVGPRSIRADVALLDASGAVVAECLDCWFVRVAFGGGVDLGSRRLSTRLILSPAASHPAPGPELLRLALGAATRADVEQVDDLAILADAFASAAALDAARAVAGAVTDHGRFDEMSSWLEVDGMSLDEAAEDTLSDRDAILRTLLFEVPAAVADVALLALAGETLGPALRGEAPEPFPRALIDQFQHDSPAGARCVTALVDAIDRVASTWPATRPLRILQIDAQRGVLSRRLLARLRGVGAVQLVAATGADDAAALAEALGDDADVVTWMPGERTDHLGRFDVLVGLYALSGLGADTAMLRSLHEVMAPGALLLVAEPEPSRVWRLVQSHIRALPGDDWASRLRDAGFATGAARSLAPSLWPASLIAAQAQPAMAARPVAAQAFAVFATPADPVAVAIAAMLRRAGMSLELHGAAEIASMDHAVAAVFIVPPIATAELPLWLARIGALPQAVGDANARVTIVIQGAAAGDPTASALLGACRVLANEASNIAVRTIRLAADLAAAEAAAHAVDELVEPDAEPEVSWSVSGRLVPRLRRLPRPLAPAEMPMRLAIGRPGLLDSLEWQPAMPRQPERGQVAIAVKAAALNFRDVMWAMGLLPDEALLDGLTGPTLGLECAGVVTAVGAGVSGFAPGDRVMAFAPASLGSHAVTMAHAVLPIPAGMDFAAAATMPVAFLTTAYALGQLAQLEAGERVLVHGGAGGVGLAALQYAKHRGAIVFATAGSDSKRALLRGLGADVVMDSRSLHFADEVMRLTDGEGVDVVLNSLSGEAMERSLGVLRPFGRFLELGKRDFYGNTPIGLRPFRHNISYFGIDADQLPTRRPALAGRLFAEIADLLRDGAIRPLPHRVMGFTDVVDAFRLMQSSGHIGKVVLTPGERPAVLAPPASFAARADRTYVVTGGLDGFGLATARWLAGQGARHLALVSRRGPATPGTDELIASFAASGVQARPLACDVGDAAALTVALDQVRAMMPPIGGVVHAAVAMDDAPLFQLDASRFGRSLRPKLEGAIHLDRLTRHDPVELFLLFSSITTTFGNPGQANYVAANAGMEAVAEGRHAEGLPALAVQWGPIGDAGYLARESELGAMLERRLGNVNLTAEAALSALPSLLASGEPVVTYADIRWGGLRSSLPLLAGPMFAALGSAEAEIAPVDLRELLATLSTHEAQERVSELLVKEVARILKLSADKVDPRAPLGDFGMDSLMAVELRLAVEQRFGITIPVLALSEGATLAVLAHRVVRGLGDPKPDGDAELRGRLARFEEGTAAAIPERSVPSPVSELTAP